MEKIEIGYKHLDALADLFVNKSVESRGVDATIMNIKSLAGDKNAAKCVSIGLQKGGLKNAMFASNVAMALTKIQEIQIIKLQDMEDIQQIQK